MIVGMLRGEKLRNQHKTGEFAIRDRHTLSALTTSALMRRDEPFGFTVGGRCAGPSADVLYSKDLAILGKAV